MNMVLLKNRQFSDSQKLFDGSQFCELLKRNKNYAKLPLSWKKIFNAVIVIPKKARYCTECKKIQFVLQPVKRI